MSTLRTLIREVLKTTPLDKVDPRDIVPDVIAHMTEQERTDYLAEALIDPVRLAIRDLRRQAIQEAQAKPGGNSTMREKIAEHGRTWKEQRVYVNHTWKLIADCTITDIDYLITDLRRQASDLNHRADFYEPIRDYMEANNCTTVAEVPEEVAQAA